MQALLLAMLPLLCNGSNHDHTLLFPGQSLVVVHVLSAFFSPQAMCLVSCGDRASVCLRKGYLDQQHLPLVLAYATPPIG
jgi:hypothetical protein